VQKTEELFHKWNADRRASTFESRLLANRLKARFRCSLDVAFQAMNALRAEDTFEKLVLNLKSADVRAPPIRTKLKSKAEVGGSDTQAGLVGNGCQYHATDPHTVRRHS